MVEPESQNSFSNDMKALSEPFPENNSTVPVQVLSTGDRSDVASTATRAREMHLPAYGTSTSFQPPQFSTLPRNASASTNASYRTAAVHLSTNTDGSYRTAPTLNGLSNASMRSQSTFASALDVWPSNVSLQTPKQPSFKPGQALYREEHPSFVLSKSTQLSNTVSKSQWLAELQRKGILLPEWEALDWSGKGQHVEYVIGEESEIPLKVEHTIGHSATALVEAVRCRRIRLARKRIRCNRRLSPYDAIVEVQHLQRIEHYHIVRVVGTYIIRKDLSILLYPVTEWNLEEFMDDTIDQVSDIQNFSNSYEHRTRSLALRTFFGCLSHALRYIHNMNIKHMDIKPKNFLVRSTKTPLADRVDNYKVYIADFGIARSYNTAQDAETDSWTSFTRMYAAPEVILQEKRWFSADIFSFGCVMVEMLATILTTPTSSLRSDLQSVRISAHGDTSYQANIPAVKQWVAGLDKQSFLNDPRYVHARKANIGLLEKIPYCLDAVPFLRPSADDLAACTRPMRCLSCDKGSEPFKAAEPLQ